LCTNSRAKNFGVHVVRCKEETCICAPRCPVCSNKIVDSPNEVCNACCEQDKDRCSKCKREVSTLYGKSLMCSNCMHSGFTEDWCAECGLYSEFTNSSKRCPECEAQFLWSSFNTRPHTGQCMMCNNWRPLNADDTCQFCFTHSTVEKVFPTCESCGKASTEKTCMNCSESSTQCFKCDKPFNPIGDEVLV